MKKKTIVTVCVAVLLVSILSGFNASVKAEEQSNTSAYTEEVISIKPMWKVDPALDNPKRMVIADGTLQVYDWKQKSIKNKKYRNKSRLFRYSVKGKKLKCSEINLCKEIKTELHYNMAQMQDSEGNLHCLYIKHKGEKRFFCYVVCDKTGKRIKKYQVTPKKIFRSNERIHFPEDDTTDSMNNNIFYISDNKLCFGYTASNGESSEADCRLGAAVLELDLKKGTLKKVISQKGNVISVGADGKKAIFYDINKKEYKIYNGKSKKCVNSIPAPNTDRFLCGSNPRAQYVKGTLYCMDGHGVYKAKPTEKAFTQLMDFSQEGISLYSEEEAQKLYEKNDMEILRNKYYPYTLSVISDEEMYIGGTTVIEHKDLAVIYHYKAKKS